MRIRLLITTLATAALTLSGAAAAFGLVTIHENEFNSKSKFKQVTKFSGGKGCKKFHDRGKRFGVAVNTGETKCIFRTRVEGDGAGPDHEVDAKFKVNKSTGKGVRNKIYGAVGVRSDKKIGYELRVFPKKGQWELHRAPGGNGFPVTGKSGSIKGIGKNNRISVRAFGNEIVAKINGKKVLTRVDTNAARVSGRIVTLAAANLKDKKKNVRVTFDSVKVKLPDP
ncbi:MAG: hypothetical protein ACR2N5_04580 [Solirubrobacterales bacterium]